jgi:uncharacterized protein with NAD-binding domain and iron-sulfur cluster
LEKRRIVIVGGGMAGLAAAYELTRTKELRTKHSVTLYQMGWRLGGKCASGRDNLEPGKESRIIEHGLHIWFGYYENAFRLLRGALEEWRAPDGTKKNIDDAFEPNNRAAIGGDKVTDPDGFAKLDWPQPPKEGELGEGDAEISVWDGIVGTINFAARIYDQITKKYPDLKGKLPNVAIPLATRSLMLEAGLPSEQLPPSPAAADAQRESPTLTSDQVVLLAKSWAELAPRQARPAEHLRGIASLLRSHAEVLHGTDFAETEGEVLKDAIDVGAALFMGVAVDLLLGGMTTVQLDQWDFRDWLIAHGARQDSVAGRVVQDVYDIMFQYREGDRRQPSYGAGTATQVVLRLLGTYKGALAWKLKAGMGEAVIAPLFEVLKKEERVKFCFFHKLIDIGLTSDGSAVTSLTFAKQVKLKSKSYEPTSVHKGLVCWPEKPFWESIVGGAALAGRSVDFESYWCAEPAVGTVTLEQGKDGDEGFDDVILAIPVGVIKRLGTARSPCDALIAANRRFRAMVENAVLVPSISVQAWSTRTVRELGWADSASCVVCVPEPLSIWSDMSHLLPLEGWPVRPGSPVSLHYFCDVIASRLHRQPPPHAGRIALAPGAPSPEPARWLARSDQQRRSAPDVQREANELARQKAIEWFAKEARVLWPNFDWDMLYAAQGRGSERMRAQIVRANVDPAGCCVSSAARTTQWRLKTHQSGFAHLYLAGAWIDTGFNTECVEAAVMSGMQASRAICGSPKRIPGEDFLSNSDATGFFGRAVESLVSLAGVALGWPDVLAGDDVREEGAPS